MYSVKWTQSKFWFELHYCILLHLEFLMHFTNLNQAIIKSNHLELLIHFTNFNQAIIKSNHLELLNHFTNLNQAITKSNHLELLIHFTNLNQAITKSNHLELHILNQAIRLISTLSCTHNKRVWNTTYSACTSRRNF